MSYLYRITFLLIVIIWVLIAIAAISETFRNSVWFVGLVYSPPLLWTIWLFFPALNSKRTLWQVLLLWVLIDATVLALLYLFMVDTENMSGPSGEDAVLLVLFCPIDLPLLVFSYFIPTIGHGLSVVATEAGNVFVGTKGALHDWVGMSVLAASGSTIYVALCRHWHNRQMKNQKPR